MLRCRMLRHGGHQLKTSAFSGFLARHTSKGREVVLELPLQKTDLANRYSASSDGKSFVLLVEGPSPRLMVVPIADKAAAADVREFPLP